MGTYDGVTATLYVDGAFVNSGSQAGTISESSSQTITVGSTAPWWNGNYVSFEGYIDEIEIYNYALPANLVQQNSARTTIHLSPKLVTGTYKYIITSLPPHSFHILGPTPYISRASTTPSTIMSTLAHTTH